jgi:hypothetical protein
MDSGSQKPLRLFANPFAIWTDLAFKTGEAMLVALIPAADAPAHATAPRNAKVAVIPTAEAPPKAKPASKAMRFKAARAKLRSKANAKRRARR